MITEFIILFLPVLALSVLVTILNHGSSKVFLACVGLSLSVVILLGELSTVYLIFPIIFMVIPLYSVLSGYMGGGLN